MGQSLSDIHDFLGKHEWESKIIVKDGNYVFISHCLTCGKEKEWDDTIYTSIVDKIDAMQKVIKDHERGFNVDEF